MRKLIIPFFAVATLSACAYNQKPVVDMTNVDQAKYEQDYKYCQGYAEQVDKSEYEKTEAANGAATGAIIGAIAGIFEDGLGGAVVGAAAGGAVGAGSGALSGANDATGVQSKVLRSCLRQKGYKVYD